MELGSVQILRRQRKTYSKQTGLILACITLLVIFVVAVIAKRTSVFIGSTFYLIVIVPIIIKSWKYDTDLGTMLVGGLLRGAIWTGLFIGMAILSRNNPLIEKIVLWPIK